jgi:hypothetical protein
MEFGVLIAAVAGLGVHIPSGSAAGEVPVCSVSGASDGVTARATAACSVPPDGLIVEPLDCRHLSFELVIGDDTKTAVFPDRVIDHHTMSSAPTNSSNPEGHDNHFGTVVDVLGPGGPVRLIGSAVYQEFGDRRFSATGRWWRRTCWEVIPATGQLEPATSDGPFPEGAEVHLSELLDRASALVDPPPVPPVAHAGPASILQLPTWFWVDERWWSLRHRHGQAHGLATVTVVAVPARWRLTDTSHHAVLLICQGRGETWRQGRSDRRACTHVFTERSAVIELALTVEMDVYWTSSIAGYGVQSLDPILRATNSDHLLLEVVGLGSP